MRVGANRRIRIAARVIRNRRASGIFTYLCARRIDLLGSLRACITISNYSVDRAYAAWKAAWAARRGMALRSQVESSSRGEGIVVASSLRKRRSRSRKCHEAGESVKSSWTFSRNVRANIFHDSSNSYINRSRYIRFRKVFVNGRNNKKLEFLKLVEIYFGRKKLKFNFLDEIFDYNTVIRAVFVIRKGRGLRT